MVSLPWSIQGIVDLRDYKIDRLPSDTDRRICIVCFVSPLVNGSRHTPITRHEQIKALLVTVRSRDNPKGRIYCVYQLEASESSVDASTIRSSPECGDIAAHGQELLHSLEVRGKLTSGGSVFTSDIPSDGRQISKRPPIRNFTS